MGFTDLFLSFYSVLGSLSSRKVTEGLTPSLRSRCSTHGGPFTPLLPGPECNVTLPLLRALGQRRNECPEVITGAFDKKGWCGRKKSQSTWGITSSEEPHRLWDSRPLACKAGSTRVTKQPLPGHPPGKGSKWALTMGPSPRPLMWLALCYSERSFTAYAPCSFLLLDHQPAWGLTSSEGCWFSQRDVRTHLPQWQQWKSRGDEYSFVLYSHHDLIKSFPF